MHGKETHQKLPLKKKKENRIGEGGIGFKFSMSFQEEREVQKQIWPNTKI